MIYYRIRNIRSNKCLDVPGFSRDEGVQVQQWDENVGLNQAWSLEAIPPIVEHGEPTFKIRSAINDLILDVRGNVVDDHGVVQQYHDHDGLNQQWFFGGDPAVLHRNGIFYITAANTRGEKVMDVVDASFDAGAKVQTYRQREPPDPLADCQQWRLEVLFLY